MSARSFSLPSTRQWRAAVLVLAGTGAVLALSSGAARADVSPHTRTSVAAGGTATSWGSVTQCAGCHRAHTGQASMLLRTAAAPSLKSPTTTLCLTCHDGTGATLDVAADFTKATPNDPATRSYYQHDVTAVTGHTLGSDDEFGGVFERHSECTDCHDPHDASAVPSVSNPTTEPWTASGRIIGTSGVRVTNGGAGSTPAYQFVNGTSATITAEYQLCLKCHSGYTKLLPDIPGRPSMDMLDAGMEFNPANSSYHPVEAPGRNATTAMANSLEGGSKYKLWTFTTTSTVRCTSCHSGAIADPPNSGVTAGSSLATHSSTYRGILVQNYEDRVLTATGLGFDESNFALCFLCHSDSPFISADRSATNFSLHQLHAAQIGSSSSGVPGTIDTPGAGQGNALCAECHFRPHSTATDPAQNTGLVAFAPNVTGAGTTTTPTWTSLTPGTGSCTLTCHGHEHTGSAYIPTGKP